MTLSAMPVRLCFLSAALSFVSVGLFSDVFSGDELTSGVSPTLSDGGAEVFLAKEAQRNFLKLMRASVLAEVRDCRSRAGKQCQLGEDKRSLEPKRSKSANTLFLVLEVVNKKTWGPMCWSE